MSLTTMLRICGRVRKTPFLLQVLPHSVCVIVLIVVVRSSVVLGSLTGDVEILRTAAVMYRENLDRIETWQGRVKMVRDYVDKNAKGRIECEIDFAHDINRKRSRHKIAVTKDVENVNGTERDRMALEVRTGIFRDGAYHRVVRPTDSENDVRIAVVQSERFMKPGFSYGTFEPMFFFTNEGEEFDRRWMQYYEWRDQPTPEVSVKRDGDKVLITQEQVSPAFRLHEVFEIDLGCGGNTVLRRFTLVEGKSEETFVYRWEWEEVNGVFVPRRITKDYTRTGTSPEEYHVTLQWEKNTVNDELPADEFSLVRLGLRRGDRVEDTRTNIAYVIEGAEFPPNPASRPDLPTRRTWLVAPVVTILLIVTLLALLVFTRIHRYQRTP